MTFEILGVLILLMIVGAIIAIETSKLLSSIICVGAVGFLLAIAFLMLGAPDIAITQIVVDILCLVILIRATISRDLTEITGDREFFGMIVTVALVLVLVLIGVKIFDQQFPEFGKPVMEHTENAPSSTYLSKGLDETGGANIVTSVLLDYRAYDTLGEATVFFCAILGGLAILRQKARRKPGEPSEETDTE